jgi:hypothetical protein
MITFLKPPKVYSYERQWIVKGEYKHEGIEYKRKSASIKGDELDSLLALPSAEDREQRAIELAKGKWIELLPSSESHTPAISEGAEPISSGKRPERERTAPKRLDKEQSPIKRKSGVTGQRHEAKQDSGKKHRARNIFRSSTCNAARAWQQLGSFVLHALLLTSVLGEYNRLRVYVLCVATTCLL